MLDARRVRRRDPHEPGRRHRPGREHRHRARCTHPPVSARRRASPRGARRGRHRGRHRRRARRRRLPHPARNGDRAVIRSLCTWLTTLLLLAGVAGAQNEGPPQEWLEGIGENELVLIHGLGASAEIWDEVRPYLSTAFQLHVYELHGHGQTPTVPDPSIQTEADALRAWIQEHGLVYPTLVGHGLGGMIALQYAFDHPGDVDRLVVIDAGPRQLASEDQKVEIAESLMEDYDRFVASRFVSISRDDEICDQAVDWALRTDAPTFTSLLMSSFDWDLTEDLPRQSVPMLVIGSAAYLPEPGHERHFLEHYGYAEARVLSFKRIPETGHYLMLEKPTYLASVLTMFLRADEMTTE
ncbi:alpha/beta fold hydrolase [bacterium]|nr:alpha/beta fold hydrolase [bacterium]